METIDDVQQYLESSKYNMTARCWLNNTQIKQCLLEEHFIWNEYLIKINKESKVRPLTESIEYYLKNPWLIDNQFDPPL